MKKLFFVLSALSLFFGSEIVFAEEGKTISVEQNAVLDSDYRKVFQSSWFIQPQEGSSVQEIHRLLYQQILPKFRYLFFFAALVFWAIAVTQMISALGNEEKISTQRKTMALGVVGFLLVSLAAEIGRVLTPLDNREKIIDISGTQAVIQKGVAFLQVAIGLVALVMIFYAAIRFIKSNGEDDDIKSAKEQIKWGFVGIIFAILAEPIVNRVFFPKDKTLGKEEITNFAQEAMSFVQFALTFLAALALVALVISGFYLVTSFGDEERQGKAKSIIISTLFGLLVIALSFVLVRLFVPT